MNTRSLLLLALFIITSTWVYSQDKYEFMIVEYNHSAKHQIVVCIDGREFVTEDANFLNQKESVLNSNPLLNKIKEYQTLGWEVITFETLPGENQVSKTYMAYLKKKKTDKK
ncbi:MAG: hypothetical protein JWO32_1011 [Bacteroidetes bacterium]|nr:hypothetical protein [Bacteroidota bacterium]